MPEPLIETDDVESRFLAHRASASGAAALEEMMARARSRPRQQGPGAPAAPSTAPEGEDDAPSGVLQDIGRGVTEIPRAVVGGIRDAYQNTINLAGEVGTWVEQAANLPGLKVDKEGIRFVSSKELQELRAAGQQFDFELPDVDDPKSVTGSLVKAVSQFLTGMKGADKLLKAGGIGKLSGAAGYTRTAAQGAIANFAVFDPHQQRLSNLVQQVPALANPVTEYLAASPEDSAAEGRFKNAVEGLGFGLLTDGFIKSVRLLRHVSTVKQTAAKALESAPAPGVADDAFKLLGDETDTALVKRPPAAKGATGEPPKTFINFARIDAPEDVKRVMQELADAAKPTKDSARAGRRSFAQVELDAAHTDAWEALSNRRIGQPLSDAESVAARQLWVSATDKVVELGQLAAANPSKENLFAFRKMLAVQDMVQGEVLGARASAARSLASWRIPAGGPAERLRDVAAALDAAGGGEVASELAERVAALGRAGMLKEVSLVAEKGAYARTRDAVLEAWIAGLLSNPLTHARNVISNTLFIPVNMAERAVAGRISRALGTEGGVAIGEASQQFYGTLKAIPDAFRYAAKAARTLETGMGTGRIELPRRSALSSEALRISSSGWLGRAVDLMGSAYRLTSRGLMAEDEFFKTVGYRAQLHSHALRQATADVDAGRILPADLGKRIAETVENPPENVRLAAVDHALYMTFQQNPEWFGRLLMRAKSHAPGANILIPFVRTTTNLQRATFERTPLAPLVRQWRADIAAGGARRDLALARMGLGSMATLALADLTLSGRITGRGPWEKGQRDALYREGWKPYSVKVGDRWVTYGGLEPISGMIGIAADTAEIVTQAQAEYLDDPDIEDVVTATAAAVAGNLLNKSYLQGFSNFIEAMNDQGRGAQKYFEGLAGSGVPSGAGHLARLSDPYLREVHSMGEALRARIPGLSGSLPARRDLWGEPISRSSGFGKAFDAFSPVTSAKPTPEAIDQEILRLGLNVTMPNRRISVDGVTAALTPEQYSRYVELAGNGLKHPAWNLGAKDLLNAVVSGKHPLSPVYNLRSDGPDGGKETFIREKIADYRERARKQLLQEFPELARAVGAGQEEKRRQRIPVLAQ